jgi:hypothetical protein
MEDAQGSALVYRRKMAKHKLVLFEVPYQSESLFHSTWFAHIIDKFFSIEHYQHHENYPADTVFVMGCNGYLDSERRKYFENRRVVVDALWESNTGKWAGCFHNSKENHFIFYGNKKNIEDTRLQFVPNWFWYNESLWFMSRGYHNLKYNPTYQKKFLMPIGHWREWRQKVITSLEPYLKDSYYSCVSQNVLLPNTPTAKRMDTRYMDPIWFQDTHYSIVLESARTWEQAVCFLTEKTYKALAGFHPLMILGAPGLLELLETQGFVTFDNIFDESYDCLSDLDDKISIVIQNIESYAYGAIGAETQERVEHNFYHFYNQNLVEKGILNDIIFPLINWINQAN